MFTVRLVRGRDHETAPVRSPRDVARVAAEYLDGWDRQAVLVLALSSESRLIGINEAHVGTLDGCPVSPAAVFKYAFLTNARSVVVAHNRPSGDTRPSGADVDAALRLRAAGEVVGVPLLDALVVGFDGEYTSLVAEGLLDTVEQ